MSKNLRGYSGYHPVINLVDITADSITATNGTFTNLTIGTYSITTLNVNNLVASGTVILSGLTNQSTSNTSDHNILIHDSVTNRLYKFVGLSFNPNNNRLTVPNLTINDGLTINADAEINTDHDLYFREINQNIGGDKGVIFWENIGRLIGRRTGGLNGELQMVTEAARQTIDFQISLQGSRTNLNATNDIFFRINNNSKVEITSTQMTLLVDLIGTIITANQLTVNGIINTESVILDTGSIFNHASNVYMGLKAISNNGTNLSGIPYSIALWEDGHIRNISRNVQRFYIYNSTSGTTTERLTINDTTVTVNNDLTITGTLTVPSFTIPTLNTTTVNATNVNTTNLSVTNSFALPILNDPSSTTDRLIVFHDTATNTLRSEAVFKYNPSNNLLTVDKAELSSTYLEMTNTNITDDTTLGTIHTNNFNGFTFQMNGAYKQRITFNLIRNYVDTEITAPNPPNTNNFSSRLLFLDSNGSNTGIISCSPNLFFNPSTDTLICENLSVFTSVRLSLGSNTTSSYFPIVYSNPSNKEIYQRAVIFTYNPGLRTLTLHDTTITDDLTNGAIFDNLRGLLFNVSTANKMKIESNLITNNENTLIDANLEVTGDTTITAVNSTVSNNNRIPFIEGGGATGRLCESNLYYNPNNETLVSLKFGNSTTTNVVSSNFTIFDNSSNNPAENGIIYINGAPNNFGLMFNQARGYVFQTASTWRMRIYTSGGGTRLITMYDTVKFNVNVDIDGDIYKNTSTFSTVNRNQNILFHDSNTNGDWRIKENPTFYFKPSSETLSVPKCNLTNPNTASLSDNSNYSLIIRKASAPELRIADSTSMNYNPFDEKLFVKNIEATDITATNITGSINITCSNNTTTTTGCKIPFIDGNLSNSGVITVSNNFHFTPSTETLSVSKCNLLNPSTAGLSDNATYNLLIYKSSATELRIADSTSMNYNPSNEKFFVKNIEATDITTTDITATNTNITGSINITCANNTTTTTGCKIPFIDGNLSNSGQLNVTNNFHFNPQSSIFTAPKIVTLQGQEMFFDFDFIFHETSTAFSGTKNEIIFNNIGKISSKRETTTLNPSLEIYNTNATSIPYQVSYLHDGGVKYLSDTTTSVGHQFYTYNGTVTTENVRIDTVQMKCFNNLSANGNITTNAGLYLPNITTPSSGNYPLLILNDSVKQVHKSDTELTYNPTTEVLKTKNLLLNDGAGNGEIIVAESIKYGGGLINIPLHYTIRIGNTNSIQTIDAIGSGLQNGDYGNGTYLSILKTGVKATAYGSNQRIFDWNAYSTANATPTKFTMNNLITGLWHIIMTCQYTSSVSSTSNRVNPIVRAEINGTTMVNEGTESSYIRHQFGRVGTVRWENKLYFNTNDTIAFRTYLNYAGVTNFSSSLSSTNYTLNDFMFIATYLGPLDENDVTP